MGWYVVCKLCWVVDGLVSVFVIELLIVVWVLDICCIVTFLNFVLGLVMVVVWDWLCGGGVVGFGFDWYFVLEIFVVIDFVCFGVVLVVV